MADAIQNLTNTALGLNDTSAAHHVAGGLGGYAVLTPDVYAQEAIDILKADGLAKSNTAVIPANTVSPAITGDAEVGATLTADPGTWTGMPPPVFSYVWKRGGATIADETGQTYTTVEGDENETLTVTVTGTNAVGSASKTSAAFGPIEAAGGN